MTRLRRALFVVGVAAAVVVVGLLSLGFLLALFFHLAGKADL